jgi:hypothetical protein
MLFREKNTQQQSFLNTKPQLTKIVADNKPYTFNQIALNIYEQQKQKFK